MIIFKFQRFFHSNCLAPGHLQETKGGCTVYISSRYINHLKKKTLLNLTWLNPASWHFDLFYARYKSTFNLMRITAIIIRRTYWNTNWVDDYRPRKTNHNEDVHGSQTTNSEILGKISKIDNPVEEACFLLHPFPPLARAFFFFFFGIKKRLSVSVG